MSLEFKVLHLLFSFLWKCKFWDRPQAIELVTQGVGFHSLWLTQIIQLVLMKPHLREPLM